MSFGRPARTSVLVLTALAPLLLATQPPASAVPPVQGVSVVQLPQELRAQPRGVYLVGRTTDGHVVLDEEPTPVAKSGGPSQPRIAAPDGTTTDLDEPVGGVVGDRLVQPVSTATVTSVTSRPVDEDSWSTLDVPDGMTLIDYTEDGLLLQSGGNGAKVLSVLPWDGGAEEPVTGMPAGGSAYALSHRVGSGSLSVVNATSPGSQNGFKLLVDTAAHRAWTVDPSGAACAAYRGSAWAVNDGVLAWQEPAQDGSEDQVACTVDVPAPDAVAVGTTTQRTLVDLPSDPPSYEYQLTPVGDDVLVSLAGPDATWGASPGQPVVAVAPDGSTRTLAAWGYGVVPAPDGHVLVVTGAEPGQSSVRDLDVATGSSTEVVPVAPVHAWNDGIAIDGDRVVTADDSAYLGGVRARQVDFDAGTATASTLLDTDVADGEVTAGAGATAWSKSGWQGNWSGHRASDGTLTLSSGSKVAQTDNRWVSFASGLVEDTSDGSFRSPLSRYAGVALQDGVTYTAGSAAPGGQGDTVIATDLATKQAATIATAGCTVNQTQVAGSWMLLQCSGTGGSSWRVVDRTGATSPWQLAVVGVPYLGNGFVVARTPGGDLSWTPLSTGAADWQSLATGAAPATNFVDDDHAVAVSRGSVPTVAWADGRSAYAARLPVTTSALPPHPTGVVPPTITNVHLVPRHQSISVYWDKPADSQHVLRYEISATTGAFVTHRTGSAVADGSATSATVSNLDNGASYAVTVKVWNIAGPTTSSPVSATPIAPPAAPTNVQVQVDQRTSRATVTWDYTAASGAEPVTSFSVVTDYAEVDGLSPSARTASFVVPQATQAPVTVTAIGANQSNSAQSQSVSFPGVPAPDPDTTAPTVRLGGVPGATLDRDLAVTFAAADDRRLAPGPVDVRWRQAAFGSPFGAWSAPASWQGRGTGSLRITGLPYGGTACFSARAHDAAGNVSGWTAPSCTAVALDDRALSRSGKTSLVSGTRYFRSTSTSLTKGASLLTGPSVRGNGWVVASTCPTCGRIQVWLGSRAVGYVNLHAAAAHDRQLLRLPSSALSGRLKLVAFDKGKRVVIDGVAVPAT